MRLISILLLALTLPLTAVSAFAEGGRVTMPATGLVALQAKATVDGEIVRLGDIFRNVDEKARVAVAYAPAPGKQAILDAEWLAETARRHGIVWRPQSRFEQLVIRRSSVPLQKDAIVARVAKRLRAMGIKGEMRVALDLRVQTLHLPVSATRDFAVRDLRYNEANGRITAKLVAPADGPTYRLRLTGRLQKLIKIPVLARRMRRGEIIRNGDVVLRTLDRAQLASGALSHRSDIVGQAARRSLRRGVPLRGSDLRAPVLVRRGALVTMEIRTATIRLTARGKAMENGSRGDTVRIRNIQSKRVVEGTVVGPDRVRIKLAGSLAGR